MASAIVLYDREADRWLLSEFSSQRFTLPVLPGFVLQGPIPADPDGATPPPSGAQAIVMRHRDTELHVFLVVGHDLSDTESSWGQSTIGERSGLTASEECGATLKNVANACP